MRRNQDPSEGSGPRQLENRQVRTLDEILEDQWKSDGLLPRARGKKESGLSKDQPQKDEKAVT